MLNTVDANAAIRLFQAGEGAALANIMFFMLLFAAYFYFRYFQNDEAAG